MNKISFEPDSKYEGINEVKQEEKLDDIEEIEDDGFDSDDALEVLTSPVGSGRLHPTAVQQKRENTRGILATTFIVGFFVMLLAGFFLAAINDLPLSDKSKHLQDILLTISGVLSGPLGFVVGYYFRKADDNDSV
jgi:hypothetical protein